MTHLVSRPWPNDRHFLQSRVERRIPNPPSTHGVTFSTILNAAWSLVLAHLLGQPDIVFGTLVSGRSAPIDGIESMIGPCMNILPLRVSLDQTRTNKDLLQYVRAQQSAMIPYETTSFSDIVENCTSWPISTRFGSVVQHQNIPAATQNGADGNGLVWNAAGSISYPGLCDEVDTWLCTVPYADHITVGLRYSDWAIPSSIAGRLIDSLCEAVMDIYHNPSGAISAPTCSPLLPMTATMSPMAPATLQKAAMDYRTLSILRDCWQQILMDTIPDSVTHHVDANFFAIGGDSVNAARLSVACKKRQLNVSIQDVFDYPTLRLQTLIASGRMERERRCEREGHDIMFCEV